MLCNQQNRIQTGVYEEAKALHSDDSAHAHTHTVDSPIQTVYLTSTNVSEEQLRREVILKGPVPLTELYISAYVSVSTNRTKGRLCVCIHLRIYP